MYSRPDLLVQRLLPSFDADTVRLSFEKLKATLQDHSGSASAIVEFPRQGRDAYRGGLSSGVYSIDDIVDRTLDAGNRHICVEFDCNIRWDRHLDVWDFAVYRTSVPHISGGPRSKPVSLPAIGPQGMRKWVADGTIDLAQPLSTLGDTDEGWVVGRPQSIYLIEKVRSIPKLRRHFERRCAGAFVSLIEPLMSELTCVVEQSQLWDVCVEITGGGVGVKAFVRDFDRRLLDHWGKNNFGNRLAALGISLRRWLS